MADIPFEILPFEELPPIATSALPRRHTFYLVFWVISGQGYHHIDFETWPIMNNTLYFIAPGQVNFWEIQRKVTGYTILFTADFIATNMLEQITLQSFSFYFHAGKQPLIHIHHDAAPFFTELCDHMLLEYRSTNYGRFTVLQSMLLILLIHAQRHFSDPVQLPVVSAGEQLITRYLELVDQHYQETQSIQEYAAMLGITPGHLRDIAQEQLGTTPIQLLNRRIVLEAKRQLVHTNETIAEIGQALNFHDASYFSRFFKRETGDTPSNFRHKIREKYQHSHP